MAFWGSIVEPDLPPRDDEKPWAIGAVLASLFCALFGPLIIYLIKRDDSPFAARVAKHVLAFNIGLVIAQVPVFLLAFGNMLLFGVLGAVAQKNNMPALIAIPVVIHLLCMLLIVVLVAMVWTFTIIGAIQVAQGKIYRFPITSRFVN